MNMQTGSLRERFGFALSRVARSWRRHLDQRLAPQGVSYARWVTLIYLQRGGEGMQQKELADYMGIEAPTLVRTLDQLERLGLLERRPHPEDRRAKSVHLTPAASRDLEAFSQAAASVRRDLLAGVTEAELETSLRVLDTVLANACALEHPGEQPVRS